MGQKTHSWPVTNLARSIQFWHKLARENIPNLTNKQFVYSCCILSIPPTIQIFRPARTRGVSVPYFQAKCHFVLSNVTVRAKTIFLTQQQSVSSPNLAAQDENWYLDKRMFYRTFLVSLRCNILGLCWKQKTAKYIRNCGPGNAELHFIISRSVYCRAEFCG